LFVGLGAWDSNTDENRLVFIKNQQNRSEQVLLAYQKPIGSIYLFLNKNTKKLDFILIILVKTELKKFKVFHPTKIMKV
jgi:hypothetical protein